VKQAGHQAALRLARRPPECEHRVVAERDEEDGQGQQQPHRQGEGAVQGRPLGLLKRQRGSNARTRVLLHNVAAHNVNVSGRACYLT